jgi:hypothetical protein
MLNPKKINGKIIVIKPIRLRYFDKFDVKSKYEVINKPKKPPII